GGSYSSGFTPASTFRSISSILAICSLLCVCLLTLLLRRGDYTTLSCSGSYSHSPRLEWGLLSGVVGFLLGDSTVLLDKTHKPGHDVLPMELWSFHEKRHNRCAPNLILGNVGNVQRGCFRVEVDACEDLVLGLDHCA